MPLNAELLAQSIAARFGAAPTEYLKILCEELILHIQTYGQIIPLTVVGTAPPGGGPVVAQTIPSPPGVIK